MGSKYTTTAVSGYNASPPSDLAGDTSASNKVTWQKHLDKIGGPIKSALESINSKLVTFTDFGSRSISSSDSAAATDHMKTIEIASTVTVAVTITLADAATMAAGYVVGIRNLSAVACTIARATGGDTLNGVAANATLAAGAAVTLKVNAAANGYYDTSNNITPNGVLQMVTSTDAGSSTTSTSLANVSGSNQSITPRSTTSKILVEAQFAGSEAVLAGSNSLATFQLYDVTNATVIGAENVLSAAAETGGVATQAPCCVRAIVTNAALTARSFQLRAKTNNASAAAGATNQVWTLTEIKT